LECDYLFLDRALRHQSIDGHRPRLTDAMRAVDGLSLGRRIPPRIAHEAVVGLGEVQPEAPRLEADQKYLVAPDLKPWMASSRWRELDDPSR